MVDDSIRPPGWRWFSQGCDAFKRSFPDIAKQIPWDKFYVCPLCLTAFSEEALINRFLTREHVPPEHSGGKRMTRTCGECNWEAGREVDSHARREADLHDLATGNLGQRLKAELSTSSGRVPIRLLRTGNTLLMFGVPKATDPEVHASVMNEFATPDENWFRLNCIYLVSRTNGHRQVGFAVRTWRSSRRSAIASSIDRNSTWSERR